MFKNKIWRPKIRLEIQNYVNSCLECQKFHLGKPTYKFNGKSEIIGFLKECQMDYLGPLPTRTGNNKYILVTVEILTGFPMAWATPDTTAQTTVSKPKELI
ncbi:hypothetical protein AYI69_g7579 [Smittium culicis]|uniref:Integrase zinc-binding domain-containing protein n=1 Tax=Smittium culicis TaxID=133412 RepID=A0A1R1XR32_9FUNG|nr:hypothetical protein AYI69_g7579 [Smittium culicis]